ncbi:transmembrane protein 202 isoform X3 [Canis lupus baileyi]|uniref:transmembrane protein 202 isoform X3 n=1 Tax=Canis lupus dingo TaxID=286419 RepID=UPI0006B3C74E|nr:transmembrane protein 202 isoform X3 [Canis lupus dingo]XP_038298807.1 uncharacterized protein TMEM202 isoform X4 [Canis lupus familiaris]XP_038436834.1 uncharacterized protein TMEM202 isoform X4 [Canis lupus familiaris]|eukprot:XP_013964822.1 uncharacterized protein TMEM202 isoform X4 [Canis lupus familiaris]
MVAFSTLAGSRLRWGPGTFAVGPVGTGRARGLTAWDGFTSRGKWSKKGSRGRMLHAEPWLADWFLSLRRLTWSLPPGVGAREGIPFRLLAILNSHHKLLSPEDIRLAFLFAVRELCFIHLYTPGPNTKPDTATADKPTLPINQHPSDSMPPQRQQQHVDQIHIYIRMLCVSLCGFGLLMLTGTSSLNWVQFLVIKNGLELYAGLWITCNHELCWSHTPKSPWIISFLNYMTFSFLSLDRNVSAIPIEKSRLGVGPVTTVLPDEDGGKLSPEKESPTEEVKTDSRMEL